MPHAHRPFDNGMLTPPILLGETVTLQVNQLGSGSTVDWGNGPVEITATDEDQLTLTGEFVIATHNGCK